MNSPTFDLLVSPALNIPFWSVSCTSYFEGSLSTRSLGRTAQKDILGLEEAKSSKQDSVATLSAWGGMQHLRQPRITFSQHPRTLPSPPSGRSTPSVLMTISLICWFGPFKEPQIFLTVSLQSLRGGKNIPEKLRLWPRHWTTVSWPSTSSLNSLPQSARWPLGSSTTVSNGWPLQGSGRREELRTKAVTRYPRSSSLVQTWEPIPPVAPNRSVLLSIKLNFTASVDSAGDIRRLMNKNRPQTDVLLLFQLLDLFRFGNFTLGFNYLRFWA